MRAGTCTCGVIVVETTETVTEEVDAKISHIMLARLRETRREYMKTRYWALKRMTDAGLTCREIEERTGIPKSTVSYVLNKPESWYASGSPTAPPDSTPNPTPSGPSCKTKPKPSARSKPS